MTVESSSKTEGGGRLRLGMVGGGQGAFIGAVHRIAARLDDRYEFVAGALSSDAKRAVDSALELGLSKDRAYADFKAMAKGEASRDDGIDAVAIVTPNHLHFPVAMAFIESGIHVICDKPLVTNSADARALIEVVQERDVLFAVTYNYSGYPMIRQAREMVASGEIGTVRVIQVEYPQDWLSTRLEDSGQKQASWRTDPNQAGPGGCIGDIGTHAFHLASYVTGLVPDSLCADLHTFIEGRPLDDNVQVLLRYKGGARGMLWASQVAPGNENALKLRVYGAKGGIEWCQEDPNCLWYTPLGEPKRLLTRGGSGATDPGTRVTRIPAGHPEGYLEGFANLYTEFADAITAKKEGKGLDSAVQYPDLEAGLAGVHFIEAALESARRDGERVKL